MTKTLKSLFGGSTKGTAKTATGNTGYDNFTKALQQSAAYKNAGSKPISLQNALSKGYITSQKVNGKTYYFPNNAKTTTKKASVKQALPTTYKKLY